MINPRVLRYSRAMTDQEMDAAITIQPAEISLHGTDAIVQAELLRKALNGFYTPDRQIRKLLRSFLSVAEAQASAHFPTDNGYLKQLYKNDPWGSGPRFAICFTGLAGVGKSELLAALGRLLGEPSTTNVSGYKNIPLVPLWAMSLRDGKGLNALLGPHVREGVEPPHGSGPDHGIAVTPQKAIPIPLIKKLARRRSWRDGVCIMTLDELQSMSLGADASAAAATLLLNLLTLGPEVIYCANFSLLHKFLKRPDEDTQRLLSRPMVMYPLGPNDPDWVTFLSSLKAVAPTVLLFDPIRDGEVIHRYTFGIKRLAVLLIVEAFLIARKRDKKGTVGAEELGLAYLSFGYSINRSVVEDLRNQQILGREIKKHLWSPFPEAETDEENVVEVKGAIEAFEMRVDDALLESALPPALASAMSALSSNGCESQAKGKIVRMRPPKATIDQLMDGAKYLDK